MPPPFLLAALPVLALILALTVLRWPLLWAAAVALALTLGVAAYAGSLLPELALGAGLRGALLTLDIAIILFGAILFFQVLRGAGVVETLQRQLIRLTPDHRLQAILIAWLLGGFIEGIAGFGTPAAVVAPLLLGLGFSPLRAVLITLLANSTTVTFGAVGTPIRIGFAGLPAEGVAETAATLNLFTGLLVPLLMLAVVVQARPEGRVKAFLQALPWALWAGLAFTVPTWLLVRFGQEFATLLGALTGLLLVGLSLKLRWLVPKHVWRLPEAPTAEMAAAETAVAETPSEGTASPASAAAPAESPASGGKIAAVVSALPALAAVPPLVPYGLLVALLLLGKFGFGSLRWAVGLPGALQYNWALFNPGWMFLLALLVLVPLYPPVRQALKPALQATSVKMGLPLLALLVTTVFVQLFVHLRLLHALAQHIQPAQLAWLPAFTGAFGSFLAGSATVSNLLFGPLLTDLATHAGFAVKQVLALQLIGAAAGNMIALQNIVAVTAIVGLKKREGKIFMLLLGPCVLYLTAVILVS